MDWECSYISRHYTTSIQKLLMHILIMTVFLIWIQIVLIHLFNWFSHLIVILSRFKSRPILSFSWYGRLVINLIKILSLNVVWWWVLIVHWSFGFNLGFRFGSSFRLWIMIGIWCGIIINELLFFYVHLFTFHYIFMCY